MYAPTERQPKQYPVMTALAIAWCVIVWGVLNFLHPSAADSVRWGFVTDEDIYRGAYWGLFSMAFVHLAPLHLLFNLSWMWPLGSAFERRFGSPAFVGFILAAAFVSSSLQLFGGESSIGLSGVVYALFGFAWLTRDRYPEFRMIATDQNVLIFIGWGIFCVVATYLNFLNIGNIAHASGLIFGALVGGAIVLPEVRAYVTAGLIGFVFFSVVPLGWNPRSIAWVAAQADKAMAGGNSPRAEGLYLQALDLGASPVWVWDRLAKAYAGDHKEAQYAKALSSLEKLDPGDALWVAHKYGMPTTRP